MPEFDEKYSELLVECGGNLVPFLDSVFGFLYRRSDFFTLKNVEQVSSVVGFQPGQNKNLLLAVFNKWDKFARSEAEKNIKLAQAQVPIAIKEEEVVSGEISVKEITKKPAGDDVKFPYQWSQTSSDIEIIVPVKEVVKKGKQVKVTCSKTSLKVTADSETLVNGELMHEIKAGEIMWSLLPSSHIHINLEKSSQGPSWSKLLKNEQEGLMTDSAQDLKEGDKMAVEYAMNKQQEAAKKKDENQDLERILRQAWDQEGSPFRGQPFNPQLISNSKIK